MNEKMRRLRRARRTRAKIKELALHRLCVHRTPRHIYAQIFTPNGEQVLVSASTLDKALRGEIENGGNKVAAVIVGKEVAKRAKAAGITRVAFDRSGYKYHGRVKALADTVRTNGLEF